VISGNKRKQKEKGGVKKGRNPYLTVKEFEKAASMGKKKAKNVR